MTTKHLKQRLNIGAAFAAGLAVLILLWALLTPVRVSSSASGALADEGAKPSSTPLTPAQRGPTLDILSSTLAVELRRPLRDPPPPVITPPPLQARFVGTIYQPNDTDASLAIFRMADGTERLIKANQQFDDPAGTVTVTKVGDQVVEIQWRGEGRELRIDASQ